MSRAVIVLVGGGTGGHFYPLMSIAESLNTAQAKPKLYYMGPDPYDKTSLEKEQIEFVSCPAGKRRKYFSLLNYLDFFKTLGGVFVALIKLFYLYPDVIISKGGYTSVPIVLAGWFLRIPIVVHESDAAVGSANKLASKLARLVLVSYKETLALFPAEKTALVGNPIRRELRTAPSSAPHERLGIDPSLPMILVLGGSQGAERLNELILDSLDELLTDFTIVHQTGEKHFNVVSGSAHELIPDLELFKRYHPVPFIGGDLLNDALHTATLIISRAGSGTIHEIAIHGKPAILIPIPESISHDQRTNAFTYARSGSAVVMEESNFSDGLLRAEIDRIIGNPDIYSEMSSSAVAFGRADAGDIIAELTLELAETH